MLYGHAIKTTFDFREFAPYLGYLYLPTHSTLPHHTPHVPRTRRRRRRHHRRTKIIIFKKIFVKILKSKAASLVRLSVQINNTKSMLYNNTKNNIKTTHAK